MHSPLEILFSTENMQSAMEKFERSRAWNLPLIENNTYLGFVFKAKSSMLMVKNCRNKRRNKGLIRIKF